MSQSLRTIKEGLIVGLIGYGSVALLYALFDFFAARGSLYTVDLLGKTFFRGLNDPSVLLLPIKLDTTAIFLYNGLHLIVSLVIGLVVVSLIGLSERKPSKARIVLLVIIAGFVITIAAMGFITDQIRMLLPWWSIIVANTLAVILGGTYLNKKHAGLWKRLTSAR